MCNSLIFINTLFIIKSKIRIESKSQRVDTEMFYNLTQLFLPQRNSKKRKIMYKSIKHIPKTISFMISNKGVEDCEAVLMKAGGKEI